MATAFRKLTPRYVEIFRAENHRGLREESSCTMTLPIGMLKLKKPQHRCC